MAKGKKRSDVKPFVHRTEYPRRARNLFESAIIDANRSWRCEARGGNVPPDGAPVLVRISKDKRLDVLWGNEVVAEILCRSRYRVNL